MRVAIIVLVAACSSSSPPGKPEPVKPAIKLLPSDNHAIHGHRGKGAVIDDMRLEFEIADNRPHVIAVKKVELLWRSCNQGSSEWYSREAKPVARLELMGEKSSVIAKGDASVTVPAGSKDAYVRVVFVATFEVYNGCEVFAYGVDLDLDGVRSTHEVPLHVEREFDLPEDK
jgi:hypothetical protein